MANIIGIQELVNGPRNYFIKVDIEGDGSGEEDEFPLVEVSLLGCNEVRLDRVWARFEGFSGHLEWDGTTKVPFLQIPDDDDVTMDWSRQGGLTNPKMANYTGDVNLVTSGLGAGEVGTMTLHFIKKDIP